MTCRNNDRQRCVTIGFRVSREQADRVDLLVALSGKTKQDYILERLENESMEVIPSPRMQRTLRDEMRKLCAQFERLKKGEEPSERLLDTCDLVARVYASLGEDARVEAPKTKDEMLLNMSRC